MGGNNRSPAKRGRIIDAGKQAMMEAMARKQREEQVTNARRSSSNNDFSPGLESDYSNKAADPAALFNIPVKGGISMGPGRSIRYTDEDAQEIMRNFQKAVRSQEQMR
jgi:hypothetical protein